MRHLWARIYRILGLKSRGGTPSLIEPLRTICTQKQLAKIQLKSAHAPLTVLQVAAEELEIPERELVQICAKEIDVPVRFKIDQVETVDLEVLSELRAVGAFPYEENGEVVGVVVAEPSVAMPAVESKFGRLPFALAPLDAIAKAYHDHRGHLNRELQAETQVKENKSTERDQLIIRRCIEQVIRNGENRVIFESIDSHLEYVYYLNDGQDEARGKIVSAVADSVFETLSNLAVLGRANITREDGTPVFGAKIKRMGKRTIEIFWPKELVAPQLEAKQDIPKKSADGTELVDIVLVDDDALFSAQILKMFSMKGLNIRAFTNPVEALERLKTRQLQAAVVICDRHMPEMMGEEVIKQMLDSKITSPFVVMLTSDVALETRVLAHGTGAHAFVSKGDSPSILYAQVNQLVQRWRQGVAN